MPFAVAGAMAGAGASIKIQRGADGAPLLAAVLVFARDRWSEAARRAALFAALFAGRVLRGKPVRRDRLAIVHTRIPGRITAHRHPARPRSGIGGIYHVVFSLRTVSASRCWPPASPGSPGLLTATGGKALLLGTFPAVYYLLLFPTRRCSSGTRYRWCRSCAQRCLRDVEAARAIGRGLRMPTTSSAIAVALLIITPSAASSGRLTVCLPRPTAGSCSPTGFGRTSSPAARFYFAGNIVVRAVRRYRIGQTLRY